MMLLLEKAKNIAMKAALEGGEKLLEYYRQGIYETRIKEDTSLQTEADLFAEKIIIRHIHNAFPEHTIESEESGVISNPSSPYRWTIDPLDGTENFVLGLPYFSSSIALLYEDQVQMAVVYNPIMEMLYTADSESGALLNKKPLHLCAQTTQLKKSRAFLIPDFETKHCPSTVKLRNGLYQNCRRVLDTWSPALDWCLVASGKADIVVAISGHAILPDAGMFILQKAGGCVTDFQGNPFTGKSQRYLVGSSGIELHDQMLKLINQHFFTEEYREPKSWKEMSLSNPHCGTL